MVRPFYEINSLGCYEVLNDISSYYRWTMHVLFYLKTNHLGDDGPFPKLEIAKNAQNRWKWPKIVYKSVPNKKIML